MKDKPEASCYDQAIRYLSIREHNHRELERKLQAKGFGREQIEQTMDLLEQKGFLSERRYIETFIRSSNRKHPEGRTVVFQRLMQKEADKGLSLQILDETYTEQYTMEMVQKAIEKMDRKTGESGLETALERMTKLGFRPSEIKEAFFARRNENE